MRLENIVWDARDPHRLGGFWAAALGAETVTDEPDYVEARLHLAGGAFLDLCFPHVAEPSTAPARLHPELAGGAEVVRRLLGHGAQTTDAGPVPWTVLTDPEGNAFRVREDRGAGPIAAVLLDSADPDRDAAFWSEITGWLRTPGTTTLRHPTGVGPVLELCPEPEPSRGKNRLHLDVRPDGAGDDDIVERVLAWGAVPLGTPTELSWVGFTDPSGNEFCVLARAH